MTAITLVSFNVENLAPRMTRPGGSEPSLADLVASWGEVDVVCLQEVRVRPSDAALVGAMESALPGFVCQHALNTDRYNGTFRGGRAYGVATYVRAEWREAALPRPSWEHEGRVALTRLREDLILANVYAVNGTDRPHFDPETGTVAGTRHAWKRAFVERLREELEPGRDRLVCLGDWNVTPAAIDTHPRLRTEEPHGSARRAFAEGFVGGLDLVDAYRALHPEGRSYTWFDRRAERRGMLDAARVDYALVSRSLMPRVRVADVLEARELRGASDHAPIRLVLDVS